LKVESFCYKSSLNVKDITNLMAWSLHYLFITEQQARKLCICIPLSKVFWHGLKKESNSISPECLEEAISYAYRLISISNVGVLCPSRSSCDAISWHQQMCTSQHFLLQIHSQNGTDFNNKLFEVLFTTQWTILALLLFINVLLKPPPSTFQNCLDKINKTEAHYLEILNSRYNTITLSTLFFKLPVQLKLYGSRWGQTICDNVQSLFRFQHTSDACMHCISWD